MYRQANKSRSRLCWLIVAVVVIASDIAPASSQDAKSALINDLISANHILARENIVDSFGHVSVRHPDNPARFLMTQARSPEQVSADDVMELDLDGKPLNGDDRPTYGERFIHAEIYRARPDVNAVVHNHSPTLIPFGVTKVPLRPVVNTAAFLAQGAPVFDPREEFGPTNLLVTDAARGRALASALGDRPLALMRGHGVVIVAGDVRRAVLRAVYAEMNAELLLQTLSMNTPITYMTPEEGAVMERYYDGSGPMRGTNRFWDNLKARLAQPPR